MTSSPRAKPQFWGLSEEDVRLALHNENPDNPVGIELTRIAEAYADLLRGYVRTHRRMPDRPLYVPQSPIEMVALAMLAEAAAEDE